MKQIYIASKTKHADKWLRLRGEGHNIISTWINEAGFGESKDLANLCYRCVIECSTCDGLIIYAEPDDYLKGAFIEMGVVLSRTLTPVYMVGPVLPAGSAFTYSHQVFTAKTVEEAIYLINNPV